MDSPRSASASQHRRTETAHQVFSSTVTISRCSDAAHETVSKSSGLTQRMLTTLAETPCLGEDLRGRQAPARCVRRARAHVGAR